MWPRTHLDVLADSRNEGCPIADPETITEVCCKTKPAANSTLRRPYQFFDGEPVRSGSRPPPMAPPRACALVVEP